MAYLKVYMAPVVQEVIAMYRQTWGGHYPEDVPIIQQLEQYAQVLWENYQKENETVCVEISNCFPPLIGKKSKEIFEYPFTRENASFTIAREYGFKDWAEVEERGSEVLDIEFEMAVDHLVYGRLQELKSLIDSRPDILAARSGFGHEATLLIYAGSNGVEIRRQIVPDNLIEIVAYLLESGADLKATAKVYNSEYNVAQLAGTSVHPKHAGILQELMDVLANE